MPVNVSYLYNVSINVDGSILATKRWKSWPIEGRKNKSRGSYVDFFQIDDSDGLTFTSRNKTGKIDGQGYMWWVREILTLNKAHRGHLISFNRVRNVDFSGIFVTNSPSFHIKPK